MYQRQDDASHRPGKLPTQALHRLLLVTDTWRETNGVTNTLRHTVRVTAQRGYDISIFLDLDVEGTKYVVGDGPLLATLQRHYLGQIRGGQVRFFGEKKGNDLAQLYAEADVFVFPSKTDTFGNVILEALASGVPVAAYPVPGPVDILTDPQVGALHDNLAIAVRQALANGCPAACRALAKQYTWERSTEQFLQALLPTVPAAAARRDAAWQDTSLRLEHTMSTS
jgi:hypothetical protein